MAYTTNDAVLSEAILPAEGQALWIKRVVLVVLGIAVLTVCAKLKLPVPPSPVPVTLGTFAVLTIGVAYGPRLGLATIMGYLIIGALGFDVFANSSAEKNGITYMLGGSGGYILGYVAAVAYLGWAARRGLDRSFEGMFGALLVANALIYVPGLLWLSTFANGWAQTFEWGLTPFVIGDLMKLAVAGLLIPAIWKLVGSARG